jgi:hypothetical protein
MSIFTNRRIAAAVIFHHTRDLRWSNIKVAAPSHEFNRPVCSSLRIEYFNAGVMPPVFFTGSAAS